jgi:hypothetical protein
VAEDELGRELDDPPQRRLRSRSCPSSRLTTPMLFRSVWLSGSTRERVLEARERRRRIVELAERRAEVAERAAKRGIKSAARRNPIARARQIVPREPQLRAFVVRRFEVRAERERAIERVARGGRVVDFAAGAGEGKAATADAGSIATASRHRVPARRRHACANPVASSAAVAAGARGLGLAASSVFVIGYHLRRAIEMLQLESRHGPRCRSASGAICLERRSIGGATSRSSCSRRSSQVWSR